MYKVLLFIVVSFIPLLAHNTPYSLDKFKSVLGQSHLQAPTSKYEALYGIKDGGFEYFQNQYFYLQDGKHMVFEMCGKKNRSELREKDDWYVSTLTPKVLFAKVYLFPLNQTREFTILQIHADSNRAGKNEAIINKPLLRIAWNKKYRNKYNHLWAILRLSADKDEQKYLKIDLGKRAKDFVTIKIEVVKSNMKVFVDNVLKVNRDVSYWNDFLNYFKAGVYLQGEGCSKVLFEQLKLD